MSDFNYIPVVKEAADDSHKVYLYNWETKTRFAEKDCVWDSDTQHRVHTAIEDLASNLQIVGQALAEALARIDELEARLKNQ